MRFWVDFSSVSSTVACLLLLMAPAMSSRLSPADGPSLVCAQRPRGRVPCCPHRQGCHPQRYPEPSRHLRNLACAPAGASGHSRCPGRPPSDASVPHFPPPAACQNRTLAAAGILVLCFPSAPSATVIATCPLMIGSCQPCHPLPRDDDGLHALPPWGHLLFCCCLLSLAGSPASTTCFPHALPGRGLPALIAWDVAVDGPVEAQA